MDPTQSSARRINLDNLVPAVKPKPHKTTYTFTVDEVNKALAHSLGIVYNEADFNWNVTESRDAFDRVSGGYHLTSVDVIVRG